MPTSEGIVLLVLPFGLIRIFNTKKMKKRILLLVTLCFSLNFFAQEQPSPILFIYDASGSMWGEMENKTKKEIAAEVLTATVGTLPENQNIGLIAYGHREKGNCDDIEYLADLSNDSKSTVTNAVKGLNPIGKTPLARSATMAINSLKTSNTKATIILITDGIESCDGDLCKVVAEAKAAGIDFKLHIVGFGLQEGEKEQLKCAAQAGDGQYYDAINAGGLGDVMAEATSQTVDDPAGNFSVFTTKNGEPVDAWVRPVNTTANKEIMGSRTYRDTAWVYLPAGQYDIEIKPLEGTDIPGTTISVEIQEGETMHRDVAFDGGILEVTTTNNGEPWDAVVRMYDLNTSKIVAQTRTYGKTQQMEVLAGSYKLVYQAMKIEGLEKEVEVANVEVVANATRNVGHDFKSGEARIGVQTTGGELIDATVNIHEKASGKNVARGRTYTRETNNPKSFLLSPGAYEVRIKTLGAHKGNQGTYDITIIAGQNTEKIITY